MDATNLTDAGIRDILGGIENAKRVAQARLMHAQEAMSRAETDVSTWSSMLGWISMVGETVRAERERRQADPS